MDILIGMMFRNVNENVNVASVKTKLKSARQCHQQWPEDFLPSAEIISGKLEVTMNKWTVGAGRILKW